MLVKVVSYHVTLNHITVVLKGIASKNVPRVKPPRPHFAAPVFCIDISVDTQNFPPLSIG